MSEKLGRDEGIARVYQFLSNYGDKWKEDADSGKKDGVINSSELYGFLLKNVKRWNGENKYDTADIITNFWKSIDTNVRGKMINGYSNSGHLDNNEIENMERNIKITKAINVLLTNVDGYKCPQALAKVKDRWTTSMQASLANKMSSYTGSVENQEEIIKYLKTIFQESVVKTNADCTKDLLMQTEFAQITSTYKDYKYMEDSTLNNIIDNYIGQLKGTESFQDIMDTIKCLMKDYFAVSGVPNQNGGNVGSSTAFDIIEYDENGQEAKNTDGTPKVSKPAAQTTSEERLNKFGGYNNFGMLNDLQKEIAKKSITDAIKNALKANSTYKDIYNANEAEFKDLIDNYADAKVSSASASDFESLKTFNGATFITDKSSELETIKSNITTLNTNRTTLINKVVAQLTLSETDEYGEERKDAIKKVFGDTATSKEAIEGIINKLSQAELTAKEAEFDAEIEKVNKKLPSNFLDSLNNLSVVAGQTKTINLPNNTNGYTTGHLHYSASGDSVISVKDSTYGTIEICAAKEGVYKSTITVKDDSGNVLASKEITITAKKATKDDIIGSVTSWDNKTSEHLEALYSVKGNDSHTQTDTMTDKSLKTLYENDYIIRLHISMDDSESWESARNIVDSRLDQLGDLIVSALSTSNSLDASKLKQARDNVIQQYKNQSLYDNLNDDDDGTSKYALTNNMVWRMNESRFETGHKVIGTRDDDGSDSWVWGVRFKDVVDDIIDEYFKLIGQ